MKILLVLCCLLLKYSESFQVYAKSKLAECRNSRKKLKKEDFVDWKSLVASIGRKVTQKIPKKIDTVYELVREISSGCSVMQ